MTVGTEKRSRPAGPEAILIGGSAGAIEPLEDILGGLPDDLKAPVVVVLHVLRHSQSLLPEILRHRTSRPVREPQDKEPMKPGNVYVAAPDYHLMISEGPSFALSVEEPVNYSIPSIDVLFESAADELGPAVLAIVLSGASNDGARGLKVVADAGGVVIVQDPGEAETRAMPEAALQICTEALVLPVEGIVGHLKALSSSAESSGRGSP